VSRRILIVVAASLAVAIGAPGASAAGADSHTDPTGDANGIADVSGVDVGNYYDIGAYVIWVTFANRKSLSGNEGFAIFVDSDLNPDTGNYGADYVIEFDAPDNCALLKWTGSDFSQVPSPSLHCEFEGAARVEVQPADLGGSKSVSFFLTTFAGDTIGDEVPDSGSISYTAGSGPVPLSIDSFNLAPTAPTAGHRLVAKMVAGRDDILELLSSGTVTCSLKVGSRIVPRVSNGFVGETAVCSWKVPTWAKGKPFRLSVMVAFGGTSVPSARTGVVH